MLVLIHIIALLSHYCNVFAITAYSILTITQFGLQINPLLTKMYFQLHYCKNTSTYMCTTYGNYVQWQKYFFDKPFLFGGNVQSPKMIVWFAFEGACGLIDIKRWLTRRRHYIFDFWSGNFRRSFLKIRKRVPIITLRIPSFPFQDFFVWFRI